MSRLFLTCGETCTAAGVGVSPFRESLVRGRTVDTRPTDDTGLPGPALVQADFDPRRWLGRKGLRVMDRTARLLSVSVALTLARTGRPVDPSLGLICGTMFGSLGSIVDFDMSGLSEGRRYVNPALFPNTVINSAAGQCAIRHALTGLNATVSSGMTSSLVALDWAAQQVRSGNPEMLIGGVEEVTRESVLGFQKQNLIASGGRIRPFDRSSEGTILGEAAVTFRMSTASPDGGETAMELLCTSHRQCPDPDSVEACTRLHERVLREALAVLPGDRKPGLIVSGASGAIRTDQIELSALEAVLGPHCGGIPLLAPKVVFGETLGAAGAVALLAAQQTLESGVIGAAGGRPDWEKPEAPRNDIFLVSLVGCDGNSAALVGRRV